MGGQNAMSTWSDRLAQEQFGGAERHVDVVSLPLGLGGDALHPRLG